MSFSITKHIKTANLETDFFICPLICFKLLHEIDKDWDGSSLQINAKPNNRFDQHNPAKTGKPLSHQSFVTNGVFKKSNFFVADMSSGY